MTPLEPLSSLSGPSAALDLQRVEEGLRLQTWMRAAQLFFPGLNIGEFRASPSAGSIQGRRFGPGELWTICSPPVTLEYSPRGGDAAGQCGLPMKESFSVLLQLGGSTLTSQNDRSCCLHAGELCLIDGATPFDLEVAEPLSHVMFLRMPRRMLLSRHPYLEQQTATVFATDEHGAGLLRSVLLDVLNTTAGLGQEQCAAVLIGLAQMLGALKVHPANANRRVQAALTYIDAHLSEPSLSAARVAQAQHMSRRRLDEIMLQAARISVSGQIWRRRLTQASEHLLDPRQAGRSVGDIAFDCGFADTAHFARAFKRQYGCTPREWRNRALPAMEARGAPSRESPKSFARG